MRDVRRSGGGCEAVLDDWQRGDAGRVVRLARVRALPSLAIQQQRWDALPHFILVSLIWGLAVYLALGTLV